MSPDHPVKAILLVDDYAGYREEQIMVIGETPTRYRIRARDPEHRFRLAGRNRWLDRGQETSVPKRVVRLSR
jgi:hypothetical protein